MCREKRNPQSEFQWIAVSNWQIFRESRKSSASVQEDISKEVHIQKREWTGKEDHAQEEYVDFLTKLMKEKKPDMLILREKQLSQEAYDRLYGAVEASFQKAGILLQRLYPHYYLSALKEQPEGEKRIHLPLTLFESYQQEEKTRRLLKAAKVGTSVHSVQEAERAQQLGASYVTAGHIFATDCKRGLSPRGLEFLKAVCNSVDIPVYAIGGIESEHEEMLKDAGAKGACQMSGYMKSSE